jgi:hypothetical protein
MAVDVRSEVVVTSGDIAQALFSKVQQDLVTQHATLVKERQELYEAAESFAKEWVAARLVEIEDSEEYARAQRWIESTNELLGTTIGLTPAVDKYSLPLYDTRWSILQLMLHISYWKDGVQWTRLPKDYVFNRTAMFMWNDPGESGPYDEGVFGFTELPLGEFTDSEFCEELNARYEAVHSMDPEIKRVKALIDGTKSETTGLSVHEQIQATITMQAINTVPQLQAAFNLDALATGVKQLLLPSDVS